MSTEAITKDLIDLLTDFNTKQKHVKGQIVISYPAGVPIASSWNEEVNPILIGALTASIKITFQKLCNMMEVGDLKRLFVNSEHGRLIVQNAGKNAVLNTILMDEADIYSLAFFITDLAQKVEKIVGDYVY